MLQKKYNNVSISGIEVYGIINQDCSIWCCRQLAAVHCLQAELIGMKFGFSYNY